MYMIEANKSELSRIKFILSYANIFTLCFSLLYSVLLLWSHFVIYLSNKDLDIFPIYLSVIIPVIFLIAYYLNLKNKCNLSKFILISTILSLNFIAGISWGFDLPSILLSYIFCIVILSLTSNNKENVIYHLFLISSILIGHYLRIYLNVEKSWHGSIFGINDIVEFMIMFIFISFLLIKFNQEQNKTLNRALRVENILRKERNNLEKIVQDKTNIIKQIQIEEISKMYHMIEFGKLSSGLYHDLITPIQTMNLYIEKLTAEHLVDDSQFSKIILNIKNTHEKLTLMLQNIRKQISLKVEDEEFYLKDEVIDLINLVKNNYFKHGVSLTIEYNNYKDKKLLTKKSILNHIILNLISNAYEACIEDKKINKKDNYEICVILGQHENKNYVSIVDNGIGIESKNLIKIFDNFYSSKNKDRQNCGVGLSSSKYYAEKYLNGKIFVESEYGVGTTMTVLF